MNAPGKFRGNFGPFAKCIMKGSIVGILLSTLIPVFTYAQHYDPRSDINGDGTIDSADLLLLQQSWHGAAPTPTSAPSPTATATPMETPAVTPTPTGEITIDLPGLPADATPLVLVRMAAGSFEMGSNDDSSWSGCYPCEQPVHTVNIGYDFYVGKYEMTQAQWLAVMGGNPSYFSGCGNNCPVEEVSWADCQVFITALNALGQGIFRLPSEAEWEYACRAGAATRFAFGDSTCNPSDCNSCDLSSYAWWCGNNGAPGTPEYGTKVVGQRLPNGFGLYDTHGNVFEWCQDWWHEDYTGAPNDGSAWEAGGGTSRVIRGGHWTGLAWSCRSSRRDSRSPWGKYTYLGFRVARSL